MAAQLVMLVLERTTPSLDVHPLPFRIAESRVEMYSDDFVAVERHAAVSSHSRRTSLSLPNITNET